MELTQENYHSKDSNKEYMSVSQYKVWRECEARAYAQFVADEWTMEKSDAIHVGQIVHKHFDGSLDKYLERHPELISSRGATKGKLKSTYQHAYKMIDTLENDKICMKYLTGVHEKMYTTEMFGCIWKGMVDVTNLREGFFSDIKTTQNIHKKTWVTYEVDGHDYNNKVSFIEAFNYHIQFAVYSEIIKRVENLKQWPDSFIVAVSSEKIPDKEVINMFSNEKFVEILSEIEEKMPRIIQLKKGELEPIRCNKCDYCKSTKQLTDFIYYFDL